MSKQKSNISNSFGNKNTMHDDIRVIMPNKTSMAVELAFNHKAVSMPIAHDRRTDKMNWQQVHDFIEILSQYVYNVTKDFNDVTILISNLGGVDRVQDYQRITETAIRDIDRFTDEFIQLKNAVKDKSGFIETPDDNVEYIRIFEKLESFNVYFQGVTHHLMIEMTEFSLEAKDRWKAMQDNQQVVNQETTNGASQ